MQRLAGFIGRLPAETAMRTVTAMASAMQRDPHRLMGHCWVPELNVHLAWATADVSLNQRVAPSQPPESSLVVAGDCLLPIAGGAARSDADGTAGWVERLREDDTTALASLNGFFAGVFVDRAARRVLLFTDRHGIERLYACETEDGLYFASEAKALLSVLRRTRTFDPEGLAEYVAFGCTRPPRTLFQDISVVPQAAHWIWAGNAWDRRRYFDSATWEAQDELPLAEFERVYAETFRDVLPAYFAGRVGLALTGGLDTRMILAARPAGWSAPLAYTYSGPHDTRDVTLAGALANACAIPHEVLRLDEGFLRDFPRHADRTVLETDGALGVTGSHESFLSARARQLAPVRMTGVFGGEVLRGLSPWRQRDVMPGLVEPGLLAMSAACRTTSLDTHPVTAAAFGTTPAAMHGILSSCRAWLEFRTPFLDARLVQLAYRAPRGEAATEHSAVRMLRQHLPALPAFPTDRGRQVGGSRHIEYAARAFQQVSFKLDYIANESLAWPFTRLDPVIDRLYQPGPLGRHKFLRYRRWFRRELEDYVRDRVDAARRMPIWRGATLGRLAEDHVSGAASVTEELNLVLTLEAVDRLLLRGASASGTDATPSPTLSVTHRGC